MSKAKEILNLAELTSKQDSPESERLDFFLGLLKKYLGMKMLATEKKPGEYKIIVYSPTKIPLGYTTFTVDKNWGDILFSDSSGFFQSVELNKVRKDIEKTYYKKYSQ